MAEPRLDRHGSEIVRQLFEENTAQVGSVGDIVEKHAGDAVFLGPSTKSPNDDDSGEADFESEMLPSDPAELDEEMDDEFPGTDDEDEQGLGETDLTGTAAGIARGFGSHLAQDLGSDGFQIQEIPDRVLRSTGRPVPLGELDDYDDDDSQNGKNDSKELEALSIPGVGAVRPREADPDAPGPYPTRDHVPHSANEAADSSERM